VSITF